MVHQKQFAVCFIKEDEVRGTWIFFRVIIEGLWAFVRNLEVKNFVWSLVDIYQVAYLSPLTSLSGSVLWSMHT